MNKDPIEINIDIIGYKNDRSRWTKEEQDNLLDHIIEWFEKNEASCGGSISPVEEDER